MFTKFLNEVGMAPERLMSLRDKFLRFTRLPISEGRVPVRELLLPPRMLRKVRSVSSPMVDGMVPERLRLLR